MKRVPNTPIPKAVEWENPLLNIIPQQDCNVKIIEAIPRKSATRGWGYFLFKCEILNGPEEHIGRQVWMVSTPTASHEALMASKNLGLPLESKDANQAIDLVFEGVVVVREGPFGVYNSFYARKQVEHQSVDGGEMHHG
jgi:hypothetical protein